MLLAPVNELLGGDFMQSDLTAYFDKRREHIANRTMFPPDELIRYAGQWIAWSPDGSRIVANATDPERLDDLVRAVGEDPEECLVEGIPAEGSVIGSMELGANRL
jgi:hypothetical protein